jgi:hypothetical protein
MYILAEIVTAVKCKKSLLIPAHLGYTGRNQQIFKEGIMAFTIFPGRSFSILFPRFLNPQILTRSGTKP